MKWTDQENGASPPTLPSVGVRRRPADTQVCVLSRELFSRVSICGILAEDRGIRLLPAARFAEADVLVVVADDLRLAKDALVHPERTVLVLTTSGERRLPGATRCPAVIDRQQVTAQRLAALVHEVAARSPKRPSGERVGAVRTESTRRTPSSGQAREPGPGSDGSRAQRPAAAVRVRGSRTGPESSGTKSSGTESSGSKSSGTGSSRAEPSGTDLSEREVQVLHYLSQGLDTTQIAQRMRYSERTIKNTLHTLMTRLKLRNRSHAVAYAIQAGLL